MKRTLEYTGFCILFGAILYALSINYLYWKRQVLIDNFHGVLVNEVYPKMYEILSYHNEIFRSQEDVIMNVFNSAVRDEITRHRPEARQLLDLIAEYAPTDHKRPVIYIAKLYAIDYILNGDYYSYLNAINWYTQALMLAKDDRTTLYNLFCLYQFREGIVPAEKGKTPYQEIKKKISDLWGPIADNARCTIGD